MCCVVCERVCVVCSVLCVVYGVLCVFSGVVFYCVLSSVVLWLMLCV